LRELRLHCFTSLQGCVRGLRALVGYARFQRSRAAHHLAPVASTVIPGPARDLLASAAKTLCEYETKALLAAYGVRVPREALARSAAEAISHASALGYPVALKIQSPDIAHKTEAGGVKLGVRDAESLRAGFDEIIATARAHRADADVRGVLVQKMAPPGRELIAGIANQSDFGPMVMVGLGGIHAEVLDDTVLAPAPCSHATARDMLARLRGARLLNGVRGEPPCDVEAMADFLVRLSTLAWDARDVILELDVNPVLLHANGAGLTVVDALAIKKS
jgi:acyl-CoA synthetase (NDP forming)